MITRTKYHRSGRGRRGAFTLIELLVVAAIIVALVALSASAVLKFVEVQQTSNTQSTLDRVQSQLTRAWSKVKDQAIKEPIPPAIYALAGTDANAAKRARYIYIKLKMRQAFPMNFAEALNVPYNNPELAAWGLPTLVPSFPAVPAQPGYVTYLASLGITPAMVSAQTAPQPYESSACLLMALQRGVSGAGINPAELTAGGAAGSVQFTLGSLPYLNDAWGRPIFFSRSPTGCFYLNPAGPVMGANDPGDPQGYLNSGAWPQNLRNTFSALNLQFLAPPTFSFKLAPMVASGGPFNWEKAGTLTFDPITFAPVQGYDALFSTP